MANPELSAQQAPVEQTRAQEVWGGVQQRFHENVMQNPEAGGIYVTTAKLAGLLAVSALATGIAFFSDRVEHSNTVTSKGGTITRIYTMPPKECHGGFDALINAKSEVDTKIDLGFAKVPTTNRASEEFTGEMSAEVCNSDVAAGSLMIDQATHHVTITIGSEDLSTVVYPKNPTDEKAWKSDNGIVKALQKNFGNVVKTLPGGLDYSGGDEVTSKLRGQALLAASDVMSRSCGNVAWNKLAEPYGEEVKKSFVASNNSALGATQITEADVNVVLPKKVSMSNQYSEQFAAMKKAAAGKDVTFSAMDPNKVVCKDTGVKVGTTAGANG